MSSFVPKRSIAECKAIIFAPGSPLEIEQALVGGEIQRVFKNLHKNARELWLSYTEKYARLPFIVFESDRLTYQDVRERTFRAASVLREIYGVRKGDRVAIAMRNFPEWIVAFWAIHLLGGVPVLVNAWLPAKVLQYCISHTDSKVIVIDAERAEVLKAQIEELKRTSGAGAVLVVRAHEGKQSAWDGMENWDQVMKNYEGKDDTAWKKEPACLPEDNCLIGYTSGTTGLPKGVLSTQRAFLSTMFMLAAEFAMRALRAGVSAPVVDPFTQQKASLLSAPLFHVLACQSVVSSLARGARVVMIRKWDPEEVARIIVTEKVNAVGGVPSIILDILETELKSAKHNLEAFTYGGSIPPTQLTRTSRDAFPNVQLMQGYGLTETNGAAALNGGQDCLARPASVGTVTIAHDVIIVDMMTLKVLPPGQSGEIWVRGPNVMKEYWKDPEVTSKAKTRDGWFRTGDLGSLDQEGFLYIRDRAKDIIIRGGENIDSSMVENALYSDPRVMECAAVGVPDRRLGELVAAIVVPKQAWKGGKVLEAELIEAAKKSLPGFAVPVMIIVQDEPLEHNATGKILKPPLRDLAREEWERRGANGKPAIAKL
ncbi:hypothetical protein BOTBODRAFT_30106 [Botryobasidium botryosum FD-172 SS1]|uniref:AMP-dependent synthetase/ligase domain-containing protein n=1 Tax=Botryobasidium botryosum (strain FD-172 SS1) TaxID=930990 RepID=A0A067MP20_BOTB1|nr:hypothetical protein BOTBODRAFT_30106 [Botryobasidium botryosum FD-172 SS1]